MPQYMLSVFMTEEPPAEEVPQIYADVDVINQQIREAGAWVFAGGLGEPSNATVVQVKAGEVVTTDGPFAEAKEAVGGFWIINADDLDAALAWARKATVACRGAVEVR